MRWLYFLTFIAVGTLAILSWQYSFFTNSTLLSLYVGILITDALIIFLIAAGRPTPERLKQKFFKLMLTCISVFLAGYIGNDIGHRIAVRQAKYYLQQVINYAEDYRDKNGSYPRRQKDLLGFGSKPYLLSEQLALDQGFIYCKVDSCDAEFYRSSGKDAYEVSFEYPAFWLYTSERPFWICGGDCRGYNHFSHYEALMADPAIIGRWYSEAQSKDRNIRRTALAALEMSHVTTVAKAEENSAIRAKLAEFDWKNAEQSVSYDPIVSKGLALLQRRIESDKITSAEAAGYESFYPNGE